MVNYSYWGFCSPTFTSQRGASHCIDNIWKTMGETLETCSRNDWVLDIYLLEGVREPFQDFRSFGLILRFPGSKSCFSYVGRSWNTGSILNSRNIWGFHGISSGNVNFMGDNIWGYYFMDSFFSLAFCDPIRFVELLSCPMKLNLWPSGNDSQFAIENGHL